MIDSGASRNLFSQRDFEALPRPPTLRPTGMMLVLAGNNQGIPLMGWIILRFNINTRRANHDFGVVRTMPIDMLIGEEFLRRHD